MSVSWRAEALADVVRLINYIAEENPVAAKKWAASFCLQAIALWLFHLAAAAG